MVSCLPHVVVNLLGVSGLLCRTAHKRFRAALRDLALPHGKTLRVSTCHMASGVLGSVGVE